VATPDKDGLPLPEVVAFTVKANFGSSKSQSQQAPPAPANQVAMKK
jgi:hypothetical protein